MIPEFTSPLSRMESTVVLGLLSRGQSVKIGAVTLHPEVDAQIIWGIDADGVTHAAASGCGAGACAQAIAWVSRVENAAAARRTAAASSSSDSSGPARQGPTAGPG